MHDSMVWIFLSLVRNLFMFAHTRKKTRTENQHRMNRHFTRHRQYDDAVFTELNWGALDFDWDENVVRVSIRDHKGHVVLNASNQWYPMEWSVQEIITIFSIQLQGMRCCRLFFTHCLLFSLRFR